MRKEESQEADVGCRTEERGEVSPEGSSCLPCVLGREPATQEGCGERAAEDEALETQGGLCPVWAELSEGPIDT